jgi:penicillin-binding protein 1C
LSVGSGQALPPPLQHFRSRSEAPQWVATGMYRDPPVTIAFPPDRAEVDSDTVRADGLAVKASGGTLPLTWLVNGTPVSVEENTRELLIASPEFGFLRVTVVDAQGRVDRVTVRVK